MNTYAKGRDAVAALVSSRRKRGFRRRVARRVERMVQRMARLRSRRKGLRRWLPLGH